MDVPKVNDYNSTFSEVSEKISSNIAKTAIFSAYIAKYNQSTLSVENKSLIFINSFNPSSAIIDCR